MTLNKDTPLKEVLELGKINCGSCTYCCTHSSGVLAEDDFQPIADFLHISVEQLKEKHLEEVTKFNTTRWRPKLLRDGKTLGPCTFLTEKGCSIHPVRPLQCRTYKCEEIGTELDQWFSLKFFVNKDDPVSMREWQIYLETSAEKVIEGGFVSEKDIKFVD